MRVVLRNNTTRKDAVYVVDYDEDEHVLVGYWGSWSRYQDKGIAGLNHQQKAHGGPVCVSIGGALIREKTAKGYFIVACEDVGSNGNYLLQRSGYTSGYSGVTFSAPPAAKPHQPIAFDKLNASLAAEKAPPAPKPEPVPEPKPARPKTRAAMLEW